MSWVIEEITTSTIGFIIAMVVLSAIIGVGLYGYWIYANHVTLENYLWPIAEVLPWKGKYFLAIVNTGYEPFYVEQIYLKGGAVLTPSQAVNPNLNWCSVSNTKLMHNQWWCGMVNQLPVAVRVCSAIDPKVCIVAPVHGWSVVTFNQPTQATFSLGNCPVLASVSDPYNAGWEVTWTAPGDSFVSGQVTKSTSYEWCIVPNYYPITIDFQASITSSPSGYTCQITPSQAQVNYEGKPETQSFTVTCQQQQQPPPPPPPPPPPRGGGSVTMTLVIDDGPGASWTAKVDQYIAGAYWIVWEQSGSSSNTYSVNLAEGYQYAISVSVPSGCTASGSPVALGSLFTATNSFTETVTITCQPTTPPPPPPPTTYGCFLTVSGQSNPQGVANVNVGPPSAFVPSGQSETIVASAPLSSGGGNSWYEFTGWSDSFSGSGKLIEISSWTGGGNAYSTWQYECPSGLTSNVTATATIIANYVHDYITLSGPTTISEGTTTAQYTLTWNVAPGSADNVQWSASVVQPMNPAQYEVSATLYYTEYGAQSSGGAQLTATLTCNYGEAVLQNVSIISQSQSGNSATITVYIEWYCQVHKGPPPQ